MQAEEAADSALDASVSAPSNVLDFSKLEASIQSFTRRFDQYVQSTVAACDEARLSADAHRADLQEHIKALERERENTKHEQKELWEQVASERDADGKLRTSVQNLAAQREALVQRTASIGTKCQKFEHKWNQERSKSRSRCSGCVSKFDGTRQSSRSSSI